MEKTIKKSRTSHKASRSKYYKMFTEIKEKLKQVFLNFLRADRILKSLGITQYNDDVKIAERNGYRVLGK